MAVGRGCGRKKFRTLSFATPEKIRGTPGSRVAASRRPPTRQWHAHTSCACHSQGILTIGAKAQEKWLTRFCFSCHCGRPCARGGARPRSTCARRRSRSGSPWSMRHRSRLARRSAGRSALATKNVALRSALERKWLLLLSDHTGETFELLGVCRLIDLVSRRTIDHLSVSFTESKVLTWSLFSLSPLNSKRERAERELTLLTFSFTSHL